MKSVFYLLFNMFKLIGAKSINDLRRRFGNPDISISSNSTREEWIKAFQKLCKDKHVNFESTCHEVIEKDNSKSEKVIFTHIWLFRPYWNYMIAKEYYIGNPLIKLGVLKTKQR